MDVTFAIALSMFSIAHFYMAAKNQTSLEDGKSSKRYDCGWRENMKTVFGENMRLWFVPVHAEQLKADGVHWKLHDGSWDGWADMQRVASDEEEL